MKTYGINFQHPEQSEPPRPNEVLPKDVSPLRFFQELAEQWLEAMNKLHASYLQLTQKLPDGSDHVFISESLTHEYTRHYNQHLRMNVPQRASSEQMVLVRAMGENGMLESFSVNFREKYCSCSFWQLTSRPCAHAMAASRKLGIAAGDNRLMITSLYDKVWLASNFTEASALKDLFFGYIPDTKDVLPLAQGYRPPPVDHFVLGESNGKVSEQERRPRPPAKQAREQPMDGVEVDPSAQASSQGSRKKICRSCGQAGHNARTCDGTGKLREGSRRRKQSVNKNVSEPEESRSQDADGEYVQRSSPAAHEAGPVTHEP